MNFSRVIFTLLFLLFAFSSCHRKTVPSSSSSSVENTPVSTSDMAKDILYYVNQHRKAIGKPLLLLNDSISSVAFQHSANMAAKRVAFGHSGFESRVSAIAKKIGSTSAAAENVAYGKISSKEVVDMWLNSAGHKKNMEGNYSLTGIGFAKDPNGIIYFTEIFVRK